MTRDLESLARRIRKDSRSLKVTMHRGSDTEVYALVVTTPFQQPVYGIQTWDDYQRAIREGRIAFQDSECCI